MGIKIDWKRLLYDRTWFGYDRVEVWVESPTEKNWYAGNWKWRWVKV